MSKSIAGFSVGDVNGVGLEVFLKGFSNELLFNQVTPVLFCHKDLLLAYCQMLDFQAPEIFVLGKGVKPKEGIINVIEHSSPIPNLHPGQASRESGEYAVQSLLSALEVVKSGDLPILVTLPFDKHTVQSEQFEFPGHTEMLAREFDVDDYMMILIGEDMRIGVVTGHVPLKDVAGLITSTLVEQKIAILLSTLRQDFGIAKPRIAVLGLNPHSGDEGLLGNEEQLVIRPVIETFRKKGEVVVGPFPADGFFGQKAYQNFDAVLSMYHDQGLVPFKQANFYSGTNFTAGLPIIRTSPDHGTAYDIAGKNKADASSLVHSIFTANRIYRQRLDYFNLNRNPLDFIRHKREKFSIGAPNIK